MRALRVALAGLFLAACGLAFGQQIATAPGCSLSGCTITGPFVLSANGAASLSAATLTGAPFAGTGTTSTPLLYFNVGVTQPVSWATAGTFLGFNAPSGYGGIFVDVRTNGGASLFSVGANGSATFASNSLIAGLNGFEVGSGSINGYSFSSTSAGNGTADTFITRAGAGNRRSGQADAAAPVPQIDSVQGVVAGTSNTAGADRDIDASVGTGTGIGGCTRLRTAPAGSTGTTQNAETNTLSVCSDGTIQEHKIYIVSTLPSCVAGLKSARTNVSDATAPTYLGTLTGSGTVFAPVVCNGTAWVSY